MQAYALSLVGVPYRWGGNSPLTGDGFDCSGLVQEILSAVGEDPPGDQTAQALHNAFLTRSRRNPPELSSLAFYGKDERSITHVGFCLNSLCMVEAGGGDSTTIDLAHAAKANAFVRIRPIRRRADLVAVLRPIWSFE